jgi:hypothetical protein
MKLTSTTPTSAPFSPDEDLRYEYRCRSTSQLELAPRTLVRRISDASGGRERYGSSRGGIFVVDIVAAGVCLETR